MQTGWDRSSVSFAANSMVSFDFINDSCIDTAMRHCLKRQCVRCQNIVIIIGENLPKHVIYEFCTKESAINHLFENWTFQHAQLFSCRILQINTFTSHSSVVPFYSSTSNTTHNLTLATIERQQKLGEFQRSYKTYTTRTTGKVYANNGTPVNYLPCIAASTPFLIPFRLLPFSLLLHNSYYVIRNHKQLLSTFLYFYFYDPGVSCTLSRTHTRRSSFHLFIHFVASRTFWVCLVSHFTIRRSLCVCVCFFFRWKHRCDKMHRKCVCRCQFFTDPILHVLP